MKYQFNFGTMGTTAPARARTDGGAVQLAVLGDFSGRANGGNLETGAELASRKPLKVDVDNLDDVIARLGIELRLPVGDDGGAVEVAIGSMDDFHPDELYDNLEIFEELAGLRRQLDSDSMFARAAEEVRSWAGEELLEKTSRGRKKARGAQIPTDGKLSDFARLTGLPSAREDAETEADELIKRIVAPHIVPEQDPNQEAYVGAVDEALSAAMRGVLHHPDFQTMEALWRSVDLLIRHLETVPRFQIVLYDITAEELAADLAGAEELQDSGLYKLLVEQPALDAHQAAPLAIIGNYGFEQTPPHAELLGRMAQIAAAAEAPFISAIGSDCLKQRFDELHPLIQDSWGALRTMPEAAYLGLVVPRFMLRLPYGKKTEPVDPFDFEEFNAKTGLKGMLWGNPAVVAGLLLSETYLRQGLKMKLGSMMSLDEMPYHYYTDQDGDQIALPCTERMLDERSMAHVTTLGFMPLLAIRGRPEVRLGSFQSLAGKPLAGAWGGAAPVAAAPDETAESAPAADAEEAPPEAPDEEAAVTDDLDEPETDSDEGDEGDEGDTAEEDESDAELDALLADLDSDDEESDDDEEEMDPELAALLADL